jgi:hypothetical protein
MKKISENTWFILAVFASAVLLWISAHHSQTLGMRPQGPHQWRQADCLSYTLNFTREEIPFTEPQVHNLGNNGTGKVVSEFPLIYYGVSRIWRVFGVHEWMYRAIVLLLSAGGLMGLFYLLREFVSRWWALFIVLLFATSPMHAYYSNNFLSNVPALSLALIGGAAHLRWERTGRWGLMLLALLAFTLGGLFKVSALLLYGALLGSMFLRWVTDGYAWTSATAPTGIDGPGSNVTSESMPDSKDPEDPKGREVLEAGLGSGPEICREIGRDRDPISPSTAANTPVKNHLGLGKISSQKKIQFSWSWLLLLLPLGVNAFWYVWAKGYNEEVGNNGFFLIGILPIWDYTTAEIVETATGALKIWFGQYFFPPVQYLTLALFIPVMLRWRRIPAVLRHITLLSSIGMGVFIILFFQVFLQHDYYLLDMMIVLPLVLAAAIQLWQPWLQKQVYIPFVAIAFAGVSLVYLHMMMNHRYTTWWMNKHLSSTQSFESFEPWLREKGIQRIDPVLVWPDRSINIPLYFMDQKGWTRFNTGMDEVSQIDALIERGLQYLILYDEDLLLREDLLPYMNEPVGFYGKIHVFWVGPGPFKKVRGPQMPPKLDGNSC